MPLVELSLRGPPLLESLRPEFDKQIDREFEKQLVGLGDALHAFNCDGSVEN